MAGEESGRAAGAQGDVMEPSMTSLNQYPIGIAGQPWGATQLAQWRLQQRKQRSYTDEVLTPLLALRERFDVLSYGELVYAEERYDLMAARSRNWQSGLPCVFVTGGVHGYETSGVQGALRFLAEHAAAYEPQVNLLIAPCVSPWAYERIQRWNFDAMDPNRSFQASSPAQESAALMRLIAPMQGQIVAHIDLHETTDTDESEFRPALAARDGKPFEPGHIPDGFYLVDNAANPQPTFQQAIIDAVQRITHIAAADEKGEIIGCPTVAHGVIHYDIQTLALCPSITGARYTTTTEVYPDSPHASPEQCIAAQVAAVCAGIDFLKEIGRSPA
jgi:Succinylglutamate desuccinylase / Aspartoacylase family